MGDDDQACRSDDHACAAVISVTCCQAVRAGRATAPIRTATYLKGSGVAGKLDTLKI